MNKVKEIPSGLYPGILEKFKKSNGCWNWLGTLTSHGYGSVYFQGKSYQAHRAVFSLLKEKVPAELVLDHLCRNRKCVNPSHLEIVTNKENNLRGTSFAAINAKKRECIRGHALKGKNLRSQEVPGRRCLSCDYIREQRCNIPRFENKCEYCQSDFLAKKKKIRFCTESCAAKWRVRNGKASVAFTKYIDTPRNERSTVRKCYMCREEKDQSEFYFVKSANRFMSRCRACHRERSRKSAFMKYYKNKAIRSSREEN